MLLSNSYGPSTHSVPVPGHNGGSGILKDSDAKAPPGSPLDVIRKDKAKKGMLD